jgi:long-chain acyl-CoA synthetase
MLNIAGEKTAITFGEARITYNMLNGKINHYAGIYQLMPGRHAVIFSENRPAWVYAFYSVWKKGGVVIPVDYMATAAEVAYILSDSEPDVIFCSPVTSETMQKAVEISGCKARIILIDSEELTETEAVADPGMPVADPDETAVIIYTSGTTGSPKGVMLSYRNILVNVYAVSKHIPIYNSESRVLVLLPLHHIFPLVGTMIIPLYLGGMMAISPSMASEDIIRTLSVNRVTILIGVPRLYAAIRKGIVDKINKSFVARVLFALARRLNSKKFSKTVFGTVHRKFGGALETLVAGGAALDTEVGNDFKTLGFEVLEGYGMTEAAPMITFTRPGRVRIGSPGECVSEMQIQISDGEIIAKGPNVMKGYYKSPEATAEVLKNGWLYTGDLGYIDKDGFLYITGRKKEIIVLSNGKNVNPVELEDELIQSPLIRDCGVFFENDQLQVLVLPEASALQEFPGREAEDIIRWEVIEPFNRRVSAYKKIMRLHITGEELPRTRLGKLQHHKLVALVQKQHIAEVTQPVIDHPEYILIAEYLEKEKGQRILPSYHPEMDLGMDSLDKVGFQVWLQQTFGVDIPPQKMAEFINLAQLAEWVADNKSKMEEGDVNWNDILREKLDMPLPSTWRIGSLAFRLSRYLFHSFFRYSTQGVDNIPDGPCIIAPNHQSSFDGLLVASAMKTKQIRATYFYAKEDHFRQKFLKYLAARNNIIIVNLNLDLKQSIQALAEVLRQGKKLIIFPEGTRTINGEPGHFKKTFAILATELNVPIVPVVIDGAYKALPKGSHFPRLWTRISVEFLKPVSPEGHSYESLTQAVRDKVQDRFIDNLRALHNEDQDEDQS